MPGVSAIYRRWSTYVIPLIISFSISVVVAHQAKNIALSDEDNAQTFYTFTKGLSEYKYERQEWKTRILSNALAGQLVKIVEAAYGTTDRNVVLPRAAALWSFFWLLGTNVLFVIVDRERSLLYSLGTFTAIMFACTPGIGAPRVYPWDMTSLFVFSVAVILMKLHKEEWLLLLVPIGTLFKETALLLVMLLVPSADIPRRRRIFIGAATIAIALSAKAIVDVVTENPSPVFTMTLSDGPTTPRYVTNLQAILAPPAWTTHPVFVNAGLLASLLILPMADRRVGILKVIAVLFIVGNFFFGNIVEYRIWFELIPLSLYGIERCFFETALARGAPVPAAPRRS